MAWRRDPSFFRFSYVGRGGQDGKLKHSQLFLSFWLWINAALHRLMVAMSFDSHRTFFWKLRTIWLTPDINFHGTFCGAVWHLWQVAACDIGDCCGDFVSRCTVKRRRLPWQSWSCRCGSIWDLTTVTRRRSPSSNYTIPWSWKQERGTWQAGASWPSCWLWSCDGVEATVV